MDSKVPDTIAFEDRCYRLDRIAGVRDDDIQVVRKKKPYTAPVLRSLGKVVATTGSPAPDTTARRKPHG